MLRNFASNVLHGLSTRLLGRGGPSSARAPVEPPLSAEDAILLAYGLKARAAGFNRLLFYLTFDCDTDEDAAAALTLDPWLRSLGIRSSYAVPGAQLMRAAEAYRQLAAVGAAFLNHGYHAHAEWRGDRYVPITFYDQFATEVVVQDIRDGDAACREILKQEPDGFRAPHFGSYQAPHQLSVIYETARELGYRYCSTTLPRFALDEGPVVDRGELYEIPLFGSRSAPTAILDSWTYLEDRKSFRLGKQYFDLFRDTVDFMLSKNIPGVLSYYVDPAHVIGQKPFLDAMEMVAARAIPSVTAHELIARAAAASAIADRAHPAQ